MISRISALKILFISIIMREMILPNYSLQITKASAMSFLIKKEGQILRIL